METNIIDLEYIYTSPLGLVIAIYEQMREDRKHVVLVPQWIIMFRSE